MCLSAAEIRISYRCSGPLGVPMNRKISLVNRSALAATLITTILILK